MTIVVGAVLSAVAVAVALVPRRSAWPSAVVLAALAEIVLGVDLLPDSARDAIDRHPLPAAAGGVLVAAALLAVAVAARRWPAAWVVALGVAIPVRVPIDLGSQTASLLVPAYAVLAGGLIAFGPGHVPRRPGPSAMVLAAIAALAAVSAAWAADPDRAAVAIAFFYLPFGLLAALLSGGTIPVAAGRAARLLIWSTLAAAAVAAAVAVVQAAGLVPLFWNENLIQANRFARLNRINAIFYDPNVLGRYAAVASLLVAALALRDRRADGRAVRPWPALAPLPGLILSLSRSGALALVSGLAVLAAGVLPARRLLAAAAAVLVVGAGAVALGASQSSPTAPLSEGRGDLIRGGVHLWAGHPVAGVGVGSFQPLYAARAERDDGLVPTTASHNAAVTVLAELGTVGAILLVALAVLAVQAVRQAHRADPAAGLALGAGLLAIAVHSLFYAALFEDPLTWAFLGLLGLLSAPPPAPAR
jgi:hypothetical protein